MPEVAHVETCSLQYPAEGVSMHPYTRKESIMENESTRPRRTFLYNLKWVVILWCLGVGATVLLTLPLHILVKHPDAQITHVAQPMKQQHILQRIPAKQPLSASNISRYNESDSCGTKATARNIIKPPTRKPAA